MKSVLLACIVCAHCDVRRNGQTPWTRQLPDGVESSKSDAGSCADHLLHQGHWAHSGSSERHLDTGWSWKAPRREADGCELLGPHAARRALRGRWVVVVGDSVARFLYSALLALVNGTDPAPGWPTHRVGEGTCMARVVANGNPNPNPNPNPNLNPNPNHNPNPNPNQVRSSSTATTTQAASCGGRACAPTAPRRKAATGPAFSTFASRGRRAPGSPLCGRACCEDTCASRCAKGSRPWWLERVAARQTCSLPPLVSRTLKLTLSLTI